MIWGLFRFNQIVSCKNGTFYICQEAFASIKSIPLYRHRLPPVVERELQDMRPSGWTFICFLTPKPARLFPTASLGFSSKYPTELWHELFRSFISRTPEELTALCSPCERVGSLPQRWLGGNTKQGMTVQMWRCYGWEEVVPLLLSFLLFFTFFGSNVS